MKSPSSYFKTAVRVQVSEKLCVFLDDALQGDSTHMRKSKYDPELFLAYWECLTTLCLIMYLQKGELLVVIVIDCALTLFLDRTVPFV